jgi:cell division septation protein DedD
MADEGVREIQLNGKQLIFLSMTTTVVLVVVFLLGVLVGRGVRDAQKDLPAPDAVTQAPAAPADAPALKPAASPPPATPPPTPPQEDLSYYARLEGQTPPVETIKPAPDTSAPGKTAGKTPAAGGAAAATPAGKAAEPGAAPAPASGTAPVAADASGAGFSVKVVAYKNRGQADSLASRLTAKGYATYVVALSDKEPTLYSVRVGKFKTRHEAEAARQRLEKEEQFKQLLITR